MVKLVAFGVGDHFCLYQNIDVRDKMDGAEFLERVNEGLFPVRRLVLSKESSRGSRLHCCLFDWYGENQHQRILQGYDRGVDKGLDYRILNSVDDQVYDARGKALLATGYK